MEIPGTQHQISNEFKGTKFQGRKQALFAVAGF